MREAMSASVARTRFMLAPLGIASAVAAIVGLVGMYGVIAQTVNGESPHARARHAVQPFRRSGRPT